MSSLGATKAGQLAKGVVGIHKKYTLQSVGFWERFRRLFAIDPDRSTGVPLNPQFRNPPPGSNDPLAFTDPVTIPAGDIAENPYWKRDVRRSYPKLSVVSQGDVVSLLTVGSATAPKQELIGEAGSQSLVVARLDGERGLASYFREDKDISAILGDNGLPPLPSGMSVATGSGKKGYEITEEQSYPGRYPCRTFE